MALTTVTKRAVNSVRAYFQREWNEQIMNVDEIPTAALNVMTAVYFFLIAVFLNLPAVGKVTGVTVLFGIDSQFLYDATWEIALGFYMFWFALYFTGSFSFVYVFSPTLVIIATVELIASTVSDYSPFFPWEVYMATAVFLFYVNAYSEMMMRKIVEKEEKNIVKHAIYLFIEFPYIAYTIARMALGRRTRGPRAPEL